MEMLSRVRGCAGDGRRRFHPLSVGVGVAVLSLVMCLASRAVRADEDVLRLANEAAAAAQSSLTSGRGSGTYRVVNGSGQVVKDVGFQVAFDHDKLNLQLEYRELPSRPRQDIRRMIVCDGSALFVTRVSTSIVPAGCETNVYEMTSQSYDIATDGFEYDLRKPNGQRANSPTQSETQRRVHFEKLPNGRYLGRYDESSNWEVTLEIAPELGYHTVKMRGANRSGNVTYSQHERDWAKENGVWYVKRMTNETKRADGTVFRRILHYDRFEPNATVPLEMFTMDALKMCEGSRVIDRRPNAQVKIYDFNTAKARQTKAEDLDKMALQMRGLSPRLPHEAPPQESSSLAVRRWPFVLGTVVLLFVVGVLVWRHR